nr:hypothetical protein [Lebetimonas sp. JH369]
MQQMILQEKYPVFVLDVYKDETHYKTTDEIIKILLKRNLIPILYVHI